MVCPSCRNEDDIESIVIMWQTSAGQAAIKTVFGSLLPRNAGPEAEDARTILLDWHCEEQCMLGSTAKPPQMFAGEPGIPVCALMFLANERGCLSLLNSIGLALSEKFWDALESLKAMGREACFEDLHPDMQRGFVETAFAFAREYVRATNFNPDMLATLRRVLPEAYALHEIGGEHERIMFYRTRALYYGLTGESYRMEENLDRARAMPA
jgi:hypothetical protein